MNLIFGGLWMWWSQKNILWPMNMKPFDSLWLNHDHYFEYKPINVFEIEICSFLLFMVIWFWYVTKMI